MLPTTNCTRACFVRLGLSDMGGGTLSRTRGISYRFLDTAVMALIAVFSFVVVMESGLRGFFAFDQSICFDGGYRVLLGQVPFKDFVAPVGPMVFWLQAVFFRLLHVNYAAYVAHAAFVNAAASVLAMVLIRMMYPEEKVVSYIVGVLTAAWFYAPFGTPWFEQTAFFFFLLGYTAMAAAARNGNRSQWLAFLGGVSGTLAFLSKQNAGALSIAAMFLFPALAPRVEKRKRLLVWYFAGLAVTAAAFAGWLSSESSPGLFVRHFFEIPLRAGESRILGLGWFSLILRDMLHYDVVAVLSGLSFIVAGVHLWFHREDGETLGLWAAVTVIVLAVFQPVFASTSRNQLENMYPFAGLIFPMAFLLVRKGWTNEKTGCFGKEGRLALTLGFAFLALVVLGYGLDVSFSRKVQDIFQDTRFVERLRTPEMSGLRWGEPTEIRGSEVSAEDFDRLMAMLESEGKEFFIFPDFTIAYGILGKEPPQPLLWFHKGLTYPQNYSAALDRWIVSDLQRHGVKIVVIERVSFMGTRSRLGDFKLLSSYIKENFVKKESVGIFDVYHLRR